MKGQRNSKGIKSRSIRALEPLEPRLLLAAIRYVDINSPGPTHDGTSWDSAFTDLQQALAAAGVGSGDQIRVADGTYKPTSGTSRSISFQLKSGVSLLGGYAGYGAEDPDARNIAGNVTILSGDIGKIGIISDNSYHVVIGSGTDATAVLDGFKITAGYANGSASTTFYGAGMYNSAGSPTVTNCAFSGNSAYGSGYGGGMYNNNSSPALTNCTFSGNSAETGGGMYNLESSPTLTNCTFSGNYCSSEAGAMYNVHSSPTLTDCTFSGNSASGGGGMYNLDSSPTLANCTFSANIAGGSLHGGGMYNTQSSPALTNCSFNGNSANGGGGMYNRNSSSPTLTNCIIWGSGSSPIYNADVTSVITYSNIEGGYTGTGNISVDPLFVRSPWTGPDGTFGWTGHDGTFGTIDDDYGDLRLRVGSPALDVGSNAGVPSGITTDLAGNPRIQNGTVDLGAYEGTSSAPAAKTLYVDLSAVGTNTGESWANAFVSLQSALLAALDGDTVRVADGTYKPTATTVRGTTFALRNSVGVFGGYGGYGAVDPDDRDTESYVTILSGDIGTIGTSTDNSYHVLVGTGTSATAVIDGFIVTAGNANGYSDPAYSGGGMYNYAGSLTLVNCTFSGNSGGFGGGMSNSSSSPTLVNCAFSGNTASFANGYGGAMLNIYSSAKLINCTFSGNSASSGGAMRNASCSPTLINCAFIGNSADNGGGMYNSSNSSSTSPTLTNCIIWGSGSSPIYNESSSRPVVTYSDIQGGYAGTGNIDADPLFVRNPSPGADSVWGTPDDDYGDLRLQAGSPCIDAGSNAAVPAGITTDLAGNPRFADVPGVKDPGVIVDMGAYEVAVPLAASSGEYLFDAPRPSLKIAFNANLSLQSLAAADLVLLNLTSGETIACGSTASVNYEQASSAATWAFGSILLPDGNYRATLPAGSVNDAAGQALSSDFSFEFFVLAGDANRDRKVDVGDLGILARNWQLSPRVFSQGDFNYDGTVNVGDLGILATNWQKTLEPPAAVPDVALSRAPMPFRRRDNAPDRPIAILA